MDQYKRSEVMDRLAIATTILAAMLETRRETFSDFSGFDLAPELKKRAVFIALDWADTLIAVSGATRAERKNYEQHIKRN
jgi:hypothetical protein